MSSLLYGSLTRRRLDTPNNETLVIAAANADGEVTVDPGKEKVKVWQDALAALVPAEVLALHAVAMSYGTTTTGSGATAVTKITYPSEMTIVYYVLMAMALVLYLVGARSFKPSQWLRGLVPVAAFVLWTMIQPSTAFDALGLELTTFARMMIAVIGAVVVGAVSTALATKANNSNP